MSVTFAGNPNEARREKSRYRQALTAYQDTSRDALESVSAYLPAVDAQIVRYITEQRGATSAEVEAATGLKHQTVSAQIRHMVEAGLLHDSGIRHTNENGRACIVWTLVPRIAPGTPGFLASLPVVASITGRAGRVQPTAPPDSTPTAMGRLF